MIFYKLLLTACVLCTVQSFRVDEGCEAKAKWDMTVRWDEFHIGVWVSSSKTDIMEIEAYFEDYEELAYNDKIVISKDEYNITKMRDLDRTYKSHNISLEVKEGWIDFFFQVDNNNYFIWHNYKNENAWMLNEEIDLKLKSIIIKGSNITINCPRKLHTWYVSKRPVVVPLDDSERHLLSFYSTGSIMPSITLGRREYPLGERDNKTSTLDDASPLRPFILHNITITCSSYHTTICIIQDTEYGHKLEEVRLGNRPEEVLVKKRGASSFSVVLFEDNRHLSLSLQDEDITTVKPEPVCTNNMLVAAMIFILYTVALLIAIYVGRYCRSLREKKLHPHTSLTKDAKRTTIDIDTTESEIDAFELNTPSRQVTLEGGHSKQYITSLSKAEAPLLKSNRVKMHTTLKEKENL